MLEITEKRRHFIRQIIEDDLASGKHTKIVTRFPPEPNGYLHIGHAKSICLNFGLAAEYQGFCNMRFDDTNPMSEELEFVEAIKNDVHWLGFGWDDRLFHASDYYDALYGFAVSLIQQGKAFVDSSSMEKIRADRGTLTAPGVPSPDRDRSVDANLDLFQRMKAGEFADGQYVLRAKIDMSSGNLNMRDPVIYRIRHAHHQMTGDQWCIYPMYDFAHSLSDALENITHSLCTLEFQDHRPLYDWCIEHCNPPGKPRQIEFARLNLSHTITSKRKLKMLVEGGHVAGWDDPRLPTLLGMRRRGYPPAALREFCEIIGISKSDSVIDMSVLEECVRNDLNLNAPRAMCVINPLKIVIENYPEDKIEMLSASAHPNNEAFGMRELPFTREIFIERDDFMLDPPADFFRLAPGKEVRLRSSYVIKCERVITDPTTGEITEIRCTVDAETLGKKPEGRKVKGVIHWVSAQNAVTAQVRLYDRLFTCENPGSEEDFTQHLNPHSLDIIEGCYIEPSLMKANPEQPFQFERLGYFVLDQKQSADNNLVFNRIVSLRDSWK
ncbi:MAG: glutamine--tRNA ligase/YqeY domain fusion protein [Pseudomonadota bacterium]|nr:glutamine--tRNA ligase/YqeY domain fusion protein [Pseudomonadota bacterium]